MSINNINFRQIEYLYQNIDKMSLNETYKFKNFLDHFLEYKNIENEIKSNKQILKLSGKNWFISYKKNSKLLEKIKGLFGLSKLDIGNKIEKLKVEYKKNLIDLEQVNREIATNNTRLNHLELAIYIVTNYSYPIAQTTFKFLSDLSNKHPTQQQLYEELDKKIKEMELQIVNAENDDHIKAIKDHLDALKKLSEKTKLDPKFNFLLELQALSSMHANLNRTYPTTLKEGKSNLKKIESKIKDLEGKKEKIEIHIHNFEVVNNTLIDQTKNYSDIALGQTSLKLINEQGETVYIKNNLNGFATALKIKNYFQWKEYRQWLTDIRLDWKEALLKRYDKVLKRNGTIHFNLTGLTEKDINKAKTIDHQLPIGGRNQHMLKTHAWSSPDQFGSHGITYFELINILRNKNLFSKTKFYNFNKNIHANPIMLDIKTLKEMGIEYLSEEKENYLKFCLNCVEECVNIKNNLKEVGDNKQLEKINIVLEILKEQLNESFKVNNNFMDRIEQIRKLINEIIYENVTT
jgi:hypothetical protein